VGGALVAVAVNRLRGGVSVPCAKLFHTDQFACHFPACAYQRRGIPSPMPIRPAAPGPHTQEAST